MKHGRRSLLHLARMSFFAMLLAGCGGAASQSETTRPDWRDATIAGIAPLMPAQQAMSIIERKGYRRISCDERSEIEGAKANHACYLSPDEGQRAFLGFEAFSGKTLVTYINFHDIWTPAASDEDRLKRSRANAKALARRFGKPAFRSDNQPGFITYYWKRPGGRPGLPDLISTTVGKDMGANVTMTSHWRPAAG